MEADIVCLRHVLVQLVVLLYIAGNVQVSLSVASWSRELVRIQTTCAKSLRAH